MGRKATKITYMPPSGNNTWKAYCAIDVGTVTSGYAYSFQDIDEIWLNKNWAESQGYHSLRVPSAILYDQDNKPKDFGFEAIDNFQSMGTHDCNGGKFSYKGILSPDIIKSDLYDYCEPYGEDIDNEDATRAHDNVYGPDSAEGHGTVHEPTDVIQTTADLAVLVATHCLTEIKDNYKAYRKSPDEVHWVLLVPYTWDILQKCRFRKLMNNRFQEEFKIPKMMFDVVNTTDALLRSLKDQPYMKTLDKEGVLVINAGGNRMETALYVGDNNEQQIVDVKFRNSGGSLINKHFEEYLKNNLGKDFVQKCQNDYVSRWVDFMQQFEIAKKNVSYTDTVNVEIILSYGFAEAFRAITGKSLKQSLNENSSEITLTSAGSMCIKAHVMKEIFSEVAELLLDDIKGILDQHNDITVTNIVLTGGFSESQFIYQYLQENIANTRNIALVKPEMSGMLTAQGALMVAKEGKKSEKAFALSYYDENIHKMVPLICFTDVIKIGTTYTHHYIVCHKNITIYEINKQEKGKFQKYIHKLYMPQLKNKGAFKRLKDDTYYYSTDSFKKQELKKFELTNLTERPAVKVQVVMDSTKFYTTVIVDDKDDSKICMELPYNSNNKISQ